MLAICSFLYFSPRIANNDRHPMQVAQIRFLTPGRVSKYRTKIHPGTLTLVTTATGVTHHKVLTMGCACQSMPQISTPLSWVAMYTNRPRYALSILWTSFFQRTPCLGLQNPNEVMSTRDVGIKLLLLRLMRALNKYNPLVL